MKYKILIYLMFLAINSWGQKHDYFWVSGQGNQYFGTPFFGGSLIDFNLQPVSAQIRQRELNMYLTNASICDTAGNLLFYTNGCAIAGADDIVLDNGYDINLGSFHNLWCNQYGTGQSGGHQNALILPFPDTQGVYALFHRHYAIVPGNAFCDAVLQTNVDMNLNSGKGKVVPIALNPL